MTPNQRSKATARLQQLPPETLAEALLDLAEYSTEARQVVQSLATTPEEAVATFKRKLSGLKRRKRFYHRSSAGIFARELESLLELLDKPSIPAKDALATLVIFFQADAKLMEMADDSHGDMGYVYCSVATKLFAKTAAKIDDQSFLIKTFKKLHEEDAYGVRNTIVEHAAEFLTSDSIELLRNYYSKLEPKNECDYKARVLTQALAAQLKNPEQFEAELRKQSDHYYCAHIIELAEIYQAAGQHEDLAKRLPEWMPKIQDHLRYQLEGIAVNTYRTIGQLDKAKAICVEKFLSHPSTINLSAAIEFTEKKEISQLKGRVNDSIFKNNELHLSHLSYLQQDNQHLLANEYLLTRHELLNGDDYSSLIPAAKAFESSGYPLAASLVWRALINSVLERSYNKAYAYTAKYVKSLHALAHEISEWQGYPDHQKYLTQLHSAHFRKKSFWKMLPEEFLQVIQTE